MSLNTNLVVAGLLVASGFVGGFFITGGSGELLTYHRQAGGGGDKGAGAQPTAVGAVDGGGGGRESPAAALPPGTRQAPALAAAARSGGGGDSAVAANGDGAGSGRQEDDAAAASEQARAAAFVSGNTVDLGPDAKQRRTMTYFAPRGVRGDIEGDALRVRRWRRDTVEFCHQDADGNAVCPPVKIRKDPGEHAPGTRVGEILIDGARWVPVLKGNVTGFPEHVPLVDSALGDTTVPAQRASFRLKDQAALTLLLNHAAADVSAARRRPGEAERILYYTDNGRRLDIVRPYGDDVAEGLSIATGWWSFAKGQFCQGAGPRGGAATCSRPEATGDGRIRLAPVKGSDGTDLLILSETDADRMRATN